MFQSYLITQTYVAPLSKAIQVEYNKVVALIELAQAHRAEVGIEGTGGKITITQLVAYQIGWGKLLVGWYEAGLKGVMPQMPGDGFETWDYAGLAHHFYNAYHYKSAAQQDQVFRDVVIKILDIVEAEYITQNLDRVGIWDWCTLRSGKKWPLSKWVQVNTVAPYKKAAGSIRKLLKSLSK
jgi:hypothetical protein